MLITALIVDILWFFIISQGFIWKNPFYYSLAGWEVGPHKFATWIGVINFFVKVGVLSSISLFILDYFCSD